jgi:hypothetical protein
MSACLLTITEQDMNNCMNPLSTQMNDNVSVCSVPCRRESLVRKVTIYNSEIEELQEVRQPAERSHENGGSLCYCGKGNKNHGLGTGCLLQKRGRTTVRKVKSLNNSTSRIPRRWSAMIL